jgi:hypothetical protein
LVALILKWKQKELHLIQQFEETFGELLPCSPTIHSQNRRKCKCSLAKIKSNFAEPDVNVVTNSYGSQYFMKICVMWRSIF